MNLLKLIKFDYTESQRRAYLTNINDLVYLTEEDVYFVSTINENIEFDVQPLKVIQLNSQFIQEDYGIIIKTNNNFTAVFFVEEFQEAEFCLVSATINFDDGTNAYSVDRTINFFQIQQISLIKATTTSDDSEVNNEYYVGQEINLEFI